MPAHNKFSRTAGVLLPVSSLPSPYGIGTLGQAAFDFVDFLHAAGQTRWQVLPVGPTSYGDSPYQSFSAFAGNPYLIDLDILCGEGLLRRDDIAHISWFEDERCVDYARIYELRFIVLREAFARFAERELPEDYVPFCADNADWLEDYCLFMALKGRFDNIEWQRWDEDIRTREQEALDYWKTQLADEIAFWRFLQYKFFGQWNVLRDYAHSCSVTIIGDIPIYVAMDSADVWAHPELFWMDENKRPVKVAGVPPDYFSKSGQLWGNPLYRWDEMKNDGFAWWRRRISFASGIYDVIRIDHFIGVVRYYTIDAHALTAVDGEWLEGPGMELVDAIDEARGSTLMIAEDLGEVAPQVRRVQRKSGWPGMKIIQFAFGSGSDNHFLPHNYEQNFVVYTGTHDNDTAQGFINGMCRREKRFAREYLGVKRSCQLCKAMIRAAMSSVAHTAIIPLPDWLELGGEARINTPSTVGGNWTWRAVEKDFSCELAHRMRKMTAIYGRVKDE